MSRHVRPNNGNGKPTKTPKAQAPAETTNDPMVVLDFENVHLQFHDREGQLWLTADQLGTALGYEESSKHVRKLYERHSDEFSDDMTTLLTLAVDELNYLGRSSPQTDAPPLESPTLNPILGQRKSYEVRVFSPRGCHLLAMLARTDRAKRFRRWVLDVLEREQLRLAPSMPKERLLPGCPVPDSLLPGFPPLTAEQLASIPRNRTYWEVIEDGLRYVLPWWRESPMSKRLRAAKRYFDLGLTLEEVGKLLDVPVPSAESLRDELGDLKRRGLNFLLDERFHL